MWACLDRAVCDMSCSAVVRSVLAHCGHYYGVITISNLGSVPFWMTCQSNVGSMWQPISLHSDTSFTPSATFVKITAVPSNRYVWSNYNVCNFINCMCFYQGWQSSLPLRRQSFVPGLQWMVTSLTTILTMKIFYLQMIPLHRAQVHKHIHIHKTHSIWSAVQKHMHTS